MDITVKNEISHRKKALALMLDHLNRQKYEIVAAAVAEAAETTMMTSC